MIVYIVAIVVFVLIAAAAVACLHVASAPQKPTSNAIKLVKPCRQRRATLKRATRQAYMLVMGGSVDLPPQRRRRA